MITERFDIPDGDEHVIFHAFQFLQQHVGELGGEVEKRFGSRGLNEYPCFLACFYCLEPEETDDGITEDDMECAYELAKLYVQLDEVKTSYEETFGAYL